MVGLLDARRLSSEHRSVVFQVEGPEKIQEVRLFSAGEPRSGPGWRSMTTDIEMDQLKTLETFVPTSSDGGVSMELVNDGQWVKLSDVQAMWIAFMTDLGGVFIEIGMDLKIEAGDSGGAAEDDEAIQLQNSRNSRTNEHFVVVNGIRINIPKIAGEHVDITTKRIVEAINACHDVPFLASMDPDCPTTIIFDCAIRGPIKGGLSADTVTVYNVDVSQNKKVL